MKHLPLILFAVIFIVSACTPAGQELVETTEITQSPPEPIPTATEIPPVVFNICTAQLPQTLNPYAPQINPAHDYLLGLLREEGLVNIEGVWQPGILEAFPSLENSGIVIETVSIQRGQRVMNVQGELVMASEGTQVRPSGCRSNDCALTWNGVDPLEMDQMVINFSFREDLFWADGTAVTAIDSVFSYQVSLQQNPDQLSWAAARTDTYSAIDEKTVQWTGKPGFTTANLPEFFWLPLPSHLAGEIDHWDLLSETQQNDIMRLSYGAYTMAAWDENEMQFELNPYYSARGEVMPEVDRFVIQQIDGSLEQAWEAFQAGRCDLLDITFGFIGQPAIRDMVLSDENAALIIVPGHDWIQFIFGIEPVIYESGVNPIFTDRPDYFGDVRTRQGIAKCLDREAIVDHFLPEMTTAWPSFLQPEKSLMQQDAGLGYDQESGIQLLEAVGWVFRAGEEIRAAENVLGVPNGTRLAIDLLVMETQFHQELAALIRDSLVGCGVDLRINAMPPSDLYAPGPDGPLFGRDFDMALIAWQPLPELDCGYYLSWQIPDAANQWVGTNTAGITDPTYDRACMDANLALPPERAGELAVAEDMYLDLLPSIPIFAPPGAVVFDRSTWCSNEAFGSSAFFRELRAVTSGEGCQ